MQVLIAEDDYDIRALIEFVFDADERLVAADGAEALGHLDEVVTLDLVVLDVMMPEVNGFEVLTSIRQHERHSQVPVIVLTAKAAEHDHVEGYRRGADRYLTKPFDIDALKRVAAELTEQSWDARSAFRKAEVERAQFLGGLERRF